MDRRGKSGDHEATPGSVVAAHEKVVIALLLVVCALAGGTYGALRQARPRMQIATPSSGVPTLQIDDYGSRRLARGSVPPPLSATQRLAGRVSMSSIAIRPKLRPLTPRPIDGEWDLSDQAKSRR
jgi:hypothetical protein